MTGEIFPVFPYLTVVNTLGESQYIAAKKKPPIAQMGYRRLYYILD